MQYREVDMANEDNKKNHIECQSCEVELRDEGSIYRPDYPDDEAYYCEECYHAEHFICESCENSFHMDYVYHSDNGYGNLYCEECYNDIFSYCEGCDDRIVRDEANWINDEQYCDTCADDLSEVTLDDYGSCQMYKSVNFSRNKWERSVGLEIEAVNPREDEMEIDYYEDHFEIKNNWRIVYDGSIDSDGGTAREFVMRGGMQGDELYQSIDNLTSVLKYKDWYVNRSCGLHIHIDARDLSPRELSSVLKVAKMSESIIYKMMPPSRWNGRWCRKIPLSLSEIDRMGLSEEHFVDSWYSAFDVRPTMEKYNDSRYCGVNMHSRIIHGSIEFRHHSGTLDPNKIINWIEICQRIVNAGENLANSNSSFYSEMYQLIEGRKEEFKYFTLEEFCWALDINDDLKNYITDRIIKFYSSDLESEYREINILPDYVTL